jgi:serine/threonine protein kinase
MSPSEYTPVNTMETIRENERPAPGLSAPLVKLHNDYYTTLRQHKLIQPFDKELNWSGKGQHVTFATQDVIPLSSISYLGSSLSATVDKVICRRIALARKTMKCDRQWTVSDALREVYHLQNLRHVHIVQLVGTYLQNRNFSILMYPAANCHLGTFLEETTDVQKKCRKDFLASTLGCLASAVAFIHERTTKHMDIKPRNILVRSDGPWWRIYLTDFGLSRSFHPQDHSQTDGPTMRTPRYCSPEVFSYDSRGRAADVFSLGCVFLEITCVIANIDLLDFIDARRGDGDDISFHANLDRVVKWARTFLRSSLLRSQGSKGEARAFEMVIGMQINMVSREPSVRPTAAEVRSRLARFPLSAFSPTTCCASPPEPYEVYEQK